MDIEALAIEISAGFAGVNARQDETNKRLDETNKKLEETNQKLTPYTGISACVQAKCGQT